MLKCVVIPAKGKEISGILPNNKRISEETELILNKREIIKCMKSATVYGIHDDGSRTLLTNSESINKAVMEKVKERTGHILKDEAQPSILDMTGTSKMEQREMKHEVKNSPNNNYNNKNNKEKNKNNNGNNTQN